LLVSSHQLMGQLIRIEYLLERRGVAEEAGGLRWEGGAWIHVNSSQGTLTGWSEDSVVVSKPKGRLRLGLGVSLAWAWKGCPKQFVPEIVSGRKNQRLASVSSASVHISPNVSPRCLRRRRGLGFMRRRYAAGLTTVRRGREAGGIQGRVLLHWKQA